MAPATAPLSSVTVPTMCARAGAVRVKVSTVLPPTERKVPVREVSPASMKSAP